MLDEGVHGTLAAQWQFHTFVRRADHLSLLHADLGIGFRGPFIGLAATLNPFVDVGFALRPGRRGMRPYASFHLVL
jgi:hypothetical protein